MFSPHGICLSWEPQLLHVASDALIAMAYFSIPLALAIFVAKRRDLLFGWVYWALCIFTTACGSAHVLSIYALWVPICGIEGLVQAATAAASIVTAGALWLLLPKLLTIPSPFELREVQAALDEEEIKSRDSRHVLERFRETQRALRESMSRLTAVVETAVDGFILIDAKARILLFNPACEKLFGYRAEEVMNCRMFSSSRTLATVWPVARLSNQEIGSAPRWRNSSEPSTASIRLVVWAKM
jgi:PAS domain-containing protein